MIVRRLLLVGLVALCGLVAWSAPAGATITHKLEFSFNGSHTPRGDFSPGSIDVDRSSSVSAGDVYVLDGGGVIDKFDSSGKYLCQITGAGSATTSASECDSSSAAVPGGAFSGGLSSVAVDPASGQLYVVDAARDAVFRFSPTGAYETEITGLSEPAKIAVDGVSGDIYIAQTGGGTQVLKYDPATATLSTFATGTPSGPFVQIPLLAVDGSLGATAGDVYVVEGSGSVIDRFSPAGVFEMQRPLLSAPSEEDGPVAVAVAPTTGNAYVAVSNPFGTGGGAVDEYTSSGEVVGQLSGFQGSPVDSMALSAGGRVYVGISNSVGSPSGTIEVFGPDVVVPETITGPASQVSASGATVEASVNPAGIQLSDCRFVYGPDTSYGQSVPCEPAAASIPADSTSHTVTARLTGLTSGVAYHYRLEAANANGSNSGADQTFTTLPSPSIDKASAANITRESADLQAGIDPNGYDTTYYFEYGTSTVYGTRIPAHSEEDADIGAGTSDVPVSIHLSELRANRTYHWRVVATNSNGTTIGSDHTFVYETAGGGLPDGRAYEMVTPPQKNGALIGDVFFLGVAPDISADGSRVMASAIQCFADAQSCTANRKYIGSPYEFSRTGSGWQTTALAPPATQFVANTEWNYSATEGTALFSMPTAPQGEDDFYARRADGSFVDIGPVTPPANGAGGPEVFTVQAATDFSHLVWIPNEEHQFHGYSGFGNSQPYWVSVSGGLNSTDLISKCGVETSNSNQGTLSGDGRTFYFEADQCPGGTGVNTDTPVPVRELFARVDNGEADAHTVAISQPSALSPAPSNLECTTPACIENTSNTSQFRDAWLEGASVDGSKAFFTSTQQLTDTAGQDSQSGDHSGKQCNVTSGPNGCNLYEYDFSNPVGRRLMDVSAGDSSGDGPRVRGVMAMSSDGSHVYFVAQGVLTAGANGQGQTASNGADNLYLFERDADHPAGRIVFIATLPASDAAQWNNATGIPSNVTADGRFLVFLSSGRLTPDDTSASGALQVFRYDAQNGELVRISAGEDGFNDNGNSLSGSACSGVELEVGHACAESARIAPGHIAEPLGGVSRLDPTMSDNGEYVFFQSPVGLTPRALDDVQIGTEGDGAAEYAQNVYEWHDGHVYLISDGRDVTVNNGASVLCNELSSVCLLGADAAGSNVFFSTADRLVAQDTDTQLDYYDARICTGDDPCIKSAPPSLLPCLGEACHGTPAGTPLVPSVPSATFNGQGNLATPATSAAKRVKAKKGVKCVKSKRRSHGRCLKTKHRKKSVRKAAAPRRGK